MNSRFALVGRTSVRIWDPAPPPRRSPDAFPASKRGRHADPTRGAGASAAALPRRLRPRPLAALALGGGAPRRRLGRSARPRRAGGAALSPSPGWRRACAPSRRPGWLAAGGAARPRSPPCSACSRRRCWRRVLAALAFAAALRGVRCPPARRCCRSPAWRCWRCRWSRRCSSMPAIRCASSPRRRAGGCSAWPASTPRAKAARCWSTAAW